MFEGRVHVHILQTFEISANIGLYSNDANAVAHCRCIAYVDASTYMLAEFVARTKLTHVGPG